MVTLKLHLRLKIYFHIEIPFPRIEPVGRIIGLNMVVRLQDAGQTSRNAIHCDAGVMGIHSCALGQEDVFQLE